MPTWVNAFGPITADGNDVGWNGFTLRQRIDAAALANFDKDLCRVTIHAAIASEGFSVSKVYIALKAAAGDPYDYASAPTQLLFGGASGFSIATGTSIVSDSAAFAIPAAAAGVVIAWVANNGTADNTRSKVTQASCFPYFKAGDDATTINATGYTDYSVTKDLVGTMRIEVADVVGGLGFWFWLKRWKMEHLVERWKPAFDVKGMQI